ncbi:MAG: GAF domain-containing protein [Roseiflexus sp.]|nr:GAF domain-containing protein [Roseiflexus sp.]MCS7288775.1 GAF domain-containing protein [Roseiflexus sp.]MDW8233892.1 GAF domain-containing protein [Roseiflexaceae bacterium]
MTTKMSADRSLHGLSNGLALQNNGAKPSSPATVCSDSIRALINRVLPKVNEWREHLTVSIGRATELTGLKDTQIRYFEELYRQDRAAAAHPGTTRSYSLADLRRLAVFAELLKEGYRPAQATEIVRSFADIIDQSAAYTIVDALHREGDAITDGFLLSRLASQIIFAAQRELRERLPDAQIITMFLVERHIDASSTAELERIGKDLAAHPQDVLVAVDRAAVVGETLDSSESVWNDDESSIVLFYSRDPWIVPVPNDAQFCCYRPPSAPDATVVFMVQSAAQGALPANLTVTTPARDHLLDWMVRMCRAIFPEFRQATRTHNYRYRSDGYRLAHTRETLNRLMYRVRDLIFGDDADASMACLLLPDDLYKPAYLSILAHAGYPDEVARRARLSLYGEGDGLSGRAFNEREPFLTRDAAHDMRVFGAQDERCQVALAVPLLSHWDTHPFGVLYLASQRPASTLLSETAFVALVFGNILSELLGRWWLTRLRRKHDDLLHTYVAEYVRWFDGMDMHGPEFHKGLQQIEQIWDRITATISNAGNARAVIERLSRQYVTLAVLDIDRSRRRHRGDEPFLLAAQRHVHQAITQILPGVQGYWFKNDHTLLVLDGCTLEEAIVLVRRIASRVQMVPVVVAGRTERTTITISAALKSLSYQELYDLSHNDRNALRASLTTIIETIHEQTRGCERMLKVFQNGGWEKV